jgi:soluble lytic murein transglycosylase-like protein
MSSHSFRARAILTCGFVLVWVMATSVLSGAQIDSVIDEHGHRIFMNSADPPPPPTKTSRNSHVRYTATPTPEITSMVDKSAENHQVDPKLVHAIIQVESGYNPRAVSRKGAEGIMQLIPSTAQRFGVRNSFNPQQNIEGGVTYLKYLLDLFNGNVPLTVAAYNAGENAVLKKGGIPAYTETVNYVQRVTDIYNPGSQDTALIKKFSEPPQAPIFRLVDARGVVHYTNGDGL